MADFYVDSSALIKRYRSELGSEVMVELFESRVPDLRIITSQFTVIEVTAVASRMLKGRVISRRSYSGLLARLREAFVSDIELLAIHQNTVVQAIIGAQKHALKAGDAIQLASALSMATASGPRGLVFVAGDSDLVAAARAEGLDTLDPEHPEALGALSAFLPS